MQRQLEKMEADLDNSKKQEQRVRDELHSHSDELKSNHQEEVFLIFIGCHIHDKMLRFKVSTFA